MQNITFPVNFQFKISSFSNDFTASDADGRIVAYVKQKMFKLKESIQIYSDETKTKINYTIKADRWLDFSAAYAFYNENENEFGKIVRKGWRSIWKAEYEIIDEFEKPQYTLTEENAFVKVFDSLLGGLPIIGYFTGYFFNPSYVLTDNNGQAIVRMKKLASFWGRNFQLTKLKELDNNDDDRILLGCMMMLLLERRRG